MSTLNVDKVDPSSGTALELGTSGDTINVPSGVTLDINSGATLDATGATITGALANTPAFSAYLSGGSQSISDATITKVTINTEWFDTDSAFDKDTNYRFTCPTGGAGKYLFCWQIVLYAANTSSNIEYLETKLYKNGSTITGTDNDYRDNEIRSAVVGNSVILDVADADYFELYGKIKQNTGSPSFSDADKMTYFSGMRLIT